MSGTSGLNAAHQAHARELGMKAIERLMVHPELVHYTQGRDRWDGIAHKKGIYKANFWPFYGDCSSTATWILWRALHVPYGVRDVVNDADWKAGYTGTMAQNGKRVDVASAKVLDLYLYGPAPTYEHVAVGIGNGKVFSHGSEGGPYILPYNYRGDLAQVRRYV